MRASALVLRSLLLGVASGGRSTAGLAAVALTTRPAPAGAGPLSAAVGALTSGGGRGLVVAGALVEVAADKLPMAPSRLTPPSLVLRMLAAAAAAGVLASREHATPAWYLLPAAAGALAGSIAGARWRSIAAEHGWPPLAAALLEDAVVAGLAAAGSARQTGD